MPNFHQDFVSFVKRCADGDDTWRFVFCDALAYVGLFLAIRGGDWQLRMACMKLMAPVFTAFNHATYQKLISNHIADVQSMPPEILTMFQQGGFVVSIKGRAWHSVGIDEAHEMLINKDCKTSIIRPSEDYINRLATYIPYRTKSLENLRQQIFPENTDKVKPVVSQFSCDSNDHKFQQNVNVQLNLINSTSLFSSEPSGIGKSFHKKGSYLTAEARSTKLQRNWRKGLFSTNLIFHPKAA